MRSQRPIDLPFFLTGVSKAQIVRTRRIGPITARSCESERGDVLCRDSIVCINETAHPVVETNDLYLRGLSQKEDSMESAISRLLETYEKGKVSRRDLVQGLVLLAASPGTMSAAGFQGNTIDHASLDVSDLERSTDFYQRTFGCPVHKRQGVPTKKSVLIEAIEFVRLQRVGCQNHVYPFRLPAFLRAYVLPTSGSSAS